MIDERKTVKTTPPAPTASAVGPALLFTKLVGRIGTRSSPSTIAPPDHPYVLTDKGKTICPPHFFGRLFWVQMFYKQVIMQV